MHRCDVYDTKNKKQYLKEYRVDLILNDNPLQYPCLENPMDRGAW